MAATRADDRAHGVGRSSAPLCVERCRARDERRFTKPEDCQLEGGCGVLRVVRRRHRRGEPPVPQARAQQHTTEQMIESFVPVPILDLDAPVPQLTEQLVEVPVPSARDCVIKETLSPVVLARYTGAAGQTWCHCSGGAGALLVADGHTAHLVETPGGSHRQLRAVYKYWARLRRHSCGRLREHEAQVPAVHAD